MTALGDLLGRCDLDPGRRGRQFERICRWFLTHDPVYAHELRRVWLWKDWPGRWGADAGIDLVAEDRHGQLWAIQAKAYDEATWITKRDVDTFLAESGRPEFSFRLLIATTDLIGRTAKRTIEAQEKQASVVLLGDLDAAEVNWPGSPSDLRARRLAPKRPRPHQRQAINAVAKGFQGADDAVTWFRAGAAQAMLSAWTGDLELARNQLSVVWQRMRDGGADLDIIWAANHMSMIDVWLGGYDDAGIAAREAVQRADQMGARQLLLTAWNVHAEVAARTGNEADARSTAAAAIAAAPVTGARQLAVAPTATLAFLEVSLGNYVAALEVLRPLLAVFDAEHGTEIVIGSYLPDAIEALVAVGRLDDAEPLVIALEEHGVRRDRAWMRAASSNSRNSTYGRR